MKEQTAEPAECLAHDEGHKDRERLAFVGLHAMGVGGVESEVRLDPPEVLLVAVPFPGDLQHGPGIVAGVRHDDKVTGFADERLRHRRVEPDGEVPAGLGILLRPCYLKVRLIGRAKLLGTPGRCPR